LEKAWERGLKEFGLTRNRGNGIVVVEYLKRVHGIRLHVRQARRWIDRWKPRRKSQNRHGSDRIQANRLMLLYVCFHYVKMVFAAPEIT